PIDNSFENLEVQAMDTIIIESQREISPDHTNVKRRRGNKKASLTSGNNDMIQKDNLRSHMSKNTNEQPLNISSSVRNNLSEDFYSQQSLTSNDTSFSLDRSPNEDANLINSDNGIQKDNLHFHTSKNIIRQNEQTLNISSSVRNNLPKSFYDQQSLASNDISSSDRSPSPESAHDQRSPFLLNRNRSKSTNIASPSLIRKSSFEEDYDQQPLASTAINTSSLIGLFKNDLEVCMYLVQHPQLVELALNMMKAGGGQEFITQGKVADKFNALSEKDLGTFQMHLKCFFFRTRVINKQVIDTLLKSLFPNIQNSASDCTALQKWAFSCFHVTDMQKTFEEQRVNVNMFTDFIKSAFDLFVQEELLDKDVINDVKDLNYKTVDMEVFIADGKEALQQINVRSLLRIE
ncbi:5226_t:CDS:2, partial [Dentiscutata heterogama]